MAMGMVPRYAKPSSRMQKIDRLGWAGGVSVYTYGLRIGIRTNKPDIMERIAQRLPPGWEPGISPLVDHLYSFWVGDAAQGPRGRNFHLLYAGTGRISRTQDLDEALDLLESDLQVYVAGHARNHLIVHAGVVGWHGRAIVVPGQSWSGKSTLVSALLRAGATYYSDEFAVLDHRGYVHPYARCLALREFDPQQHKVRSWRCRPEVFGRAAATPLPPGLVVLTRYVSGSEWQPRRLLPGKALVELLSHVIDIEQDPDMIVATLQKLLEPALILKGKRGEAEAVADALLACMEEIEPAEVPAGGCLPLKVA